MLCKMCSCACAWRARTFAQRAGLFSGSGWYSSACSSASAAVLSAFGGFFELLLCGVLHAGSRYEQRVTRRAMPVLDDPRKSASHRPRRPASNPAAHFQTHLDGMATRASLRPRPSVPQRTRCIQVPSTPSDRVKFDGTSKHVEIGPVTDAGLDHGPAHDVRGPQRRLVTAYGVFNPHRRFDNFA